MGKKGIKYYAVRKGRVPGIYTSWIECSKQVNKFSGAKYKSFQSLIEAKKYIEEDKVNDIKNCGVNAYISGSFNNSNQIYGYAGLIFYNGKKHIIQGNGNDKNLIQLGAVASQIIACQELIKKAIELEIKNIDIYYNYEGIKNWATGEWKTNRKETKDYQKFIQDSKSKLNINFTRNISLIDEMFELEVRKLAKKAAFNYIDESDKKNDECSEEKSDCSSKEIDVFTFLGEKE